MTQSGGIFPLESTLASSPLKGSLLLCLAPLLSESSNQIVCSALAYSNRSVMVIKNITEAKYFD